MKAQKTTLVGIYVMVALAILLSNLNACQRMAGNRPVQDDTLEIPVEDTVDAEDFLEEEEDTVPTEQLQGEAGRLRVALLWDFQGDIDLHVVQPNGKCVDYKRTSDSDGGGSLDVDNKIGGQGSAENIYWDAPKPGTYKVFLHFYPHENTYAGNGKCPVVVEWQKADGSKGTKQFNMTMTTPRQWKAVTDFRVEGDNVKFSSPSEQKPSASECSARRHESRCQ